MLQFVSHLAGTKPYAFLCLLRRVTCPSTALCRIPLDACFGLARLAAALVSAESALGMALSEKSRPMALMLHHFGYRKRVSAVVDHHMAPQHRSHRPFFGARPLKCSLRHPAGQRRKPQIRLPNVHQGLGALTTLPSISSGERES